MADHYGHLMFGAEPRTVLRATGRNRTILPAWRLGWATIVCWMAARSFPALSVALSAAISAANDSRNSCVPASQITKRHPDPKIDQSCWHFHMTRLITSPTNCMCPDSSRGLHLSMKSQGVLPFHRWPQPSEQSGLLEDSWLIRAGERKAWCQRDFARHLLTRPSLGKSSMLRKTCHHRWSSSICASFSFKNMSVYV